MLPMLQRRTYYIVESFAEILLEMEGIQVMTRKEEKSGYDIRLASLDPGRNKNSFAFLGGSVNEKNESIVLFLAKRWKGSLQQNYVKIEKEIADRHKLKPFDEYIVETNNTGIHVIDVLKTIHRLPIIPVTTVGKLKDQNKHPFSQEKKDMMYWILHMKAEGKIEIPPPSTSSEWAECHRQLSNYQMIMSKAGNETFTSPDDNDDYVSALINLSWRIRQKFLKIQRSSYRTISRRFTGNQEDIYGTGLRDGDVLVSKSIFYPH